MIRSAQFNLDQLTVGRDAFMQMLNASLAEDHVVDGTPDEVKEFA